MVTNRTVRLGAHEVTYTLHKRRGIQRVTLSVRQNGSVTVSVPWWCAMCDVERYLVSKREWLVDAMARIPRGAATIAKQRARYSEYKEPARALVHELLVALNTHYGFSWGRVTIRMNTASWGSCSSKRNLNFDYRILFLPKHLQEYLVVHELCHLAELNHSSRFWHLVARVVPEHKKARTELRRMVRT